MTSGRGRRGIMPSPGKKKGNPMIEARTHRIEPIVCPIRFPGRGGGTQKTRTVTGYLKGRRNRRRRPALSNRGSYKFL